MSNRERPKQENQEQEAGAGGLAERFKRAMNAITEQGKRISAITKERAEDINFRRYFNNRHIRKYVRAAVIPLVLVGSYWAIRREGAPKVESRSSAVAEITSEETGLSPAVEAKTEPVVENPLEISESEKEIAEQKAELAKKFEEFEREELEREIKRLESGAEETPEKKEPAPPEFPEFPPASEYSLAPESPKFSPAAKIVTAQENIDDEMTRLDERAIVEAIDLFMKESPKHKGSTVVKIKGNCLAVDLGRYDDYHCYKVTPVDLAQLRKAQENYQEKIYKYVSNRRPTRFSSLASERLRRSYREEAKIKIKDIFDKYCEKIDEISPWLIPDEIKEAQQERKDKYERARIKNK